LILALAFVVSVSTFLYMTRDNKEIGENSQDGDLGNDSDFLANVTRTERYKVLEFGHGSVAHGGDSRYWERDDRRRDGDYSEDTIDHSTDEVNIPAKDDEEKPLVVEPLKRKSDHKGSGLYNEAGRNELKMYEEEYEASLKNAGQSRNGSIKTNNLVNSDNDDVELDDEYSDDDDIDLHDERMEDYDDASHEKSKSFDAGEGFSNLSREDSSLKSLHSEKASSNSRHVSVIDTQSSRRSTSSKRTASKKKSKRRKFSGTCEMKLSDSTSELVEPLENPKFARFSLQYKDLEEREPKFAGHQNLEEREKSYTARDQKINCGFVKGPKEPAETGFDLSEDDTKFISTCHIAVSSCIFGNSDRLRSPMSKTVSRLSRKNVCFVMFMDEITLQTLISEGQIPDRMGFIGLWKIVIVKNLPYTDMRRVGKIPKLLSHRLFPSARYSMWLDSKLRLQIDPLLILEYFLWRKGYEYAISNHYDRHCLWEEVAQNKRLNKYNHTVIDQQFAFYQADGLKRFNASDPNKLLPSNVPEGSFIVRAHTPMSNLFSCLWFNEVERFTPRDQLSFAYTYHKLRRTNPDKPFYLNMFKDCERRKIAKLFHHRSEESRNIISSHTTTAE
jgi:hypothetical protein